MAQELRDDRAIRTANWRRIDRICLPTDDLFGLAVALSRLA